MKSSSQLLNRLLDDISHSDRLRVWSVIITIFGDAVVPRGGTIGMSNLQDITGHLGIGENALRTAMSRLAKDGWVHRSKVGRQSYYSLAFEGFSVFERASQRIYNSGNFEWHGHFEMVLRTGDDHKTRAQSQTQMRQMGFGSPMPDVYVRPTSKTSEAIGDYPANSVVVEAGKLAKPSLAEFIKRCWPVDEISQHSKDLVARFAPVLKALQSEKFSNPLDCLAVRILLIHEWRKLVLRNIDIPDDFRPSDDAVAETRKVVRGIYSLLLHPSETYLDGCKSAPNQFLPKASQVLATRFNE